MAFGNLLKAGLLRRWCLRVREHDVALDHPVTGLQRRWTSSAHAVQGESIILDMAVAERRRRAIR